MHSCKNYLAITLVSLFLLNIVGCASGSGSSDVVEDTDVDTPTDTITYYQDSDGDGFGNIAVTQDAMTQPSGFVANNTDCDDSDFLEHPGQTWFKDTDNDNYSDGETNTSSCVRPTGYKISSELTATSGDCENNDPAIYPGAAEIDCDGIDQNCDGIDSSNSECVVTFEKVYGGEDWTDSGQDVLIASDGNYLLAGVTWDYDTNANVYLIKTDTDGNEIWSYDYGGTGRDEAVSIQETSDGGYIIAGYTTSYGAGEVDFYLLKVDKDGNKLWHKAFGGSSNDYAKCIKITPDGGFVIAGITYSFGSGDGDLYLVRTDANGNKLWSKSFGGIDRDKGFSVELASDGGFLILGDTESFGAGYTDMYLVKTDADGNELWSKTYGGADSRDWGVSITRTSDGGFALLGGTYSVALNGDGDMYLVKIDADGNELWSKTYGGAGEDSGEFVQETADGGFVLLGYTQSFVPSWSDMYLVKTDSTGKMLWQVNHGGDYYDYGNSVKQTPDGGYLLIGYIEVLRVVTSLPMWGDVYLVKTDAQGQVY